MRSGTYRVPERTLPSSRLSAVGRVPAVATVATSLALKRKTDANRALLAYARGDLDTLFKYLKDQGADEFEKAAEISEEQDEGEYAEFFRKFV